MWPKELTLIARIVAVVFGLMVAFVGAQFALLGLSRLILGNLPHAFDGAPGPLTMTLLGLGVTAGGVVLALYQIIHFVGYPKNE